MCDTIEHWLRLHASDTGKVAVVCGSSSITYSQLYSLAERRAAAFRQDGCRTVVFRASQSLDFLVTYFAAHMAGRVAVPLGENAPASQVGEVEALVGGCGVPDGVADILFTTGTTGKPKGTMISHRAIIANAENLVQAQGYSSDHAFVVSGPFNHIGCLSKIWPVVMVGGTLVVVDGMKDMSAFLRAFDYPCDKMATFLVPASLRMLMQFASERLKALAHKLDFVETGAAPMSQSDMQRLCSLLPNTRLYNTYASTETGIIATHDYCHDGCMEGCLGRPMRHSSVEILADGTIVCAGDTLMSGYVGNDGAVSMVHGGDRLRTSDVGWMDSQGRLRLNGRADDMINVGGLKVSPVEVESVALRFPAIADCVCISQSHPILGNVLKLIYVSADGTDIDKRQLVAYMRQHLEQYKVPVAYERTPQVARTFNGKTDRAHYRQ